MGFSDRLRAWFKGEGKRSSPSKSTDSASRSSTKELEEFVRSRVGVEAFLEPKTAIYSTTLLLVADDGEYLRRPIKDRSQAGEFCGRVNIPLYDAAKVGYPKRMRDFEQGRRPRKIDLSELPPWPGDDVAGADRDGPPPPPSELDVSADGDDGLPELPDDLAALDEAADGSPADADPSRSSEPPDLPPDEPLGGDSGGDDAPPGAGPDNDAGAAKDRRDPRRPGRGHLPSDDDPDGGHAR